MASFLHTTRKIFKPEKDYFKDRLTPTLLFFVFVISKHSTENVRQSDRSKKYIKLSVGLIKKALFIDIFLMKIF